jgi:hypothetical protein
MASSRELNPDPTVSSQTSHYIDWATRPTVTRRELNQWALPKPRYSVLSRELFLPQLWELHIYSGVRRRGSHILETNGIQKAVSLPVLRTGSPLPQAWYLTLISVRGWVDTRAIARLEELQLKHLMTSSGIEISTYKLVRYRVSSKAHYYLQKN